VGVVLAQNKKAPLPPFPLCIGAYYLENAKVVARTGEAIVVFNYRIEKFRRHAPCGVVACHC